MATATRWARSSSRCASLKAEQGNGCYDGVTKVVLDGGRGVTLMIRVQIDEFARNFPALMDRIIRDGEVVELEQGDHVVARLTPVRTPKARTADEWNELFRNLPDLGDDATAFADDMEAARKSQTPVRDPWG